MIGSLCLLFWLSVVFLNGRGFPFTHPSVLDGVGSLNILKSSDFVSVCNCLLQVGTNSLSVYTDGFLSNLGTVGYRAGTVVFFEDIDLSLGISVLGLMSSTLVEFQPALDAWNEHANAIAGNASLSGWYLPYHLGKHFIVVNGSVVFGNSRHFVCNIYCSVCHVHWEIGFGSKFLASSLLFEIDWLHSSLVWHPDLHIAAGFTSRPLVNACSYFMKALHHWLPVAVWKHLYNRLYPNILCLYCGNVEASDHVFSYKIDDSV
ncbi:hypothetical protein G9A89_001846 [Geosiphon pyriformis]|nr:hypothetical protein G9A89_001846 [Geosiphon pyriformis]